MAGKTTGKTPAKPKETSAPAAADTAGATAVTVTAQEAPAGPPGDATPAPPAVGSDPAAPGSDRTAAPLGIAITGRQLREALAFLAPDGTEDQLDGSLVIEICPDGLVAFDAEYPEEGALVLTGETLQTLTVPPAVSNELGAWIESDPALIQIAEEVGALASLVVTERMRQIAEGRHTLDQDDEQTTYQLARAAVCYLSRAAELPPHKSQLYWPWHPATYKAESSTRSLIKGLALGLAELHRRERAGMALA